MKFKIDTRILNLDKETSHNSCAMTLEKQYAEMFYENRIQRGYKADPPEPFGQGWIVYWTFIENVEQQRTWN